jgi:hypothetical protein
LEKERQRKVELPNESRKSKIERERERKGVKSSQDQQEEWRKEKDLFRDCEAS